MFSTKTLAICACALGAAGLAYGWISSGTSRMGTTPTTSFDGLIAAHARTMVDEGRRLDGWANRDLNVGAIGIDSFQADRAPDHRYRTSPLKGLWSHQEGGFYHDGRFATLDLVVDRYDTVFGLALTDHEKHDLVECLKSI